MDMTGEDEVRDELPEDLDAAGFVGPYTFPNNDRRKTQGAIYLVVAAVVALLRAVAGSDAVLANDGFYVVAAGLAVFGLYCILAAGQPSHVDETDALVIATRTAGFPVGHASASLGWRGLRSRPTWRILLYSADDPPSQRGLVLVDAVEGGVVEHFIEDNPEEWEADQPAPDG
jgi:hypothetical protein